MASRGSAASKRLALLKPPQEDSRLRAGVPGKRRCLDLAPQPHERPVPSPTPRASRYMSDQTYKQPLLLPASSAPLVCQLGRTGPNSATHRATTRASPPAQQASAALGEPRQNSAENRLASFVISRSPVRLRRVARTGLRTSSGFLADLLWHEPRGRVLSLQPPYAEGAAAAHVAPQPPAC